MIIELSEFFNNPSLLEIGPLKIQYYALMLFSLLEIALIKLQEVE